ncbi:hypothetical protein Q5P01_015563 [Channa striata]|uniref:Uncharacterized protein n=1 Tax=Channa striata TaxID=64152 RepID=A0AA88MBN7_CHASR|nr:hypothetical protein Q5P01_015563 [Channa striata]
MTSGTWTDDRKRKQTKGRTQKPFTRTRGKKQTDRTREEGDLDPEHLEQGTESQESERKVPGRGPPRGGGAKGEYEDRIDGGKQKNKRVQKREEDLFPGHSCCCTAPSVPSTEEPHRRRTERHVAEVRRSPRLSGRLKCSVGTFWSFAPSTINAGRSRLSLLQRHRTGLPCDSVFL